MNREKSTVNILVLGSCIWKMSKSAMRSPSASMATGPVIPVKQDHTSASRSDDGNAGFHWCKDNI